MSRVIWISALALGLAAAAPSFAQSCGGPGGSCSVPKEPTAEELMGDKPAAPQQQAMCGCCRNMAMMGRGTPSMPGMNMPGMNMPTSPVPQPQKQ